MTGGGLAEEKDDDNECDGAEEKKGKANGTHPEAPLLQNCQRLEAKSPFFQKTHVSVIRFYASSCCY
jgi:hypothetical protein